MHKFPKGILNGNSTSGYRTTQNKKTYFPLNLRLQPVSFQDDMLRMCTGRDEAQEGFNIFEAVFKSKLLQIHPTKSCYLETTK